MVCRGLIHRLLTNTCGIVPGLDVVRVTAACAYSLRIGVRLGRGCAIQVPSGGGKFIRPILAQHLRGETRILVGARDIAHSNCILQCGWRWIAQRSMNELHVTPIVLEGDHIGLDIDARFGGRGWYAIRLVGRLEVVERNRS
jgi:hypothetical protein